MWIFTQYGFFSVVCAREGNGSMSQPVDCDRMMVRARAKKHLVALRKRFNQQLADLPILETDNSEYRYRVFISKTVWSTIQSALAEEIDYDNFKSAVGKAGSDSDYLESLHNVWSVMYRLQFGTRRKES